MLENININGQENILLISKDTDKAAKLAKLFSEKGYEIIIEPPLTDFKIGDIKRLVLILLVDCFDACAVIIEHLTHLLWGHPGSSDCLYERL